MARIVLPTNTLVGQKLLRLNAQIIQASQDANRLKAIKDQITPALLETSLEAMMPPGSGASISAGIDQIVTALAGLAALVSAIDQG